MSISDSIKLNIEELKRLDEALNKFKKMSTTTNHFDKVALYDLEYEYFMKFIHLYKDTQAYVKELESNGHNIFEINRFRKDLNKLWRWESV